MGLGGRLRLLLAAALLPAWRQAVLLVQPETIPGGIALATACSGDTDPGRAIDGAWTPAPST